MSGCPIPVCNRRTRQSLVSRPGAIASRRIRPRSADGLSTAMVTEPGWYPDPLGGQGARYWDGTQWEGAIQPGPPTAPQEFPEPPPTQEKARPLWPVWVGLSLAVVIAIGSAVFVLTRPTDRKSTRLNSSHVEISYAVFCL